MVVGVPFLVIPRMETRCLDAKVPFPLERREENLTEGVLDDPEQSGSYYDRQGDSSGVSSLRLETWQPTKNKIAMK